jgi:hypothetical protein
MLSTQRIRELKPSGPGFRGRFADWVRYPIRRRAFDRLVEEKLQRFPWLAQAWFDYLELEAAHAALGLATKRWPAPDAASRVREAGRRAAEAGRRAREAEYVRAFYESLFPWLPEFLDEENEELFVALEQAAGPAGDPAQHWLTDAEFRRLPVAERFQIALDRYRQRKKSRWEIGRDYERFIGYKYEIAGYSVHYQGIVEGFEDLGRDLIAVKNDSTDVVQCKYWSTAKVIHEKHINQLFGTMTAYQLDHPTEQVRAVFYTSTNLSERACQFADRLRIEVHERVPLENYPCIKCNVSRRTSERIYHLPFDQRYDRTLIEQERLECYVETVAEAEQLGFRRAHRWTGT